MPTLEDMVSLTTLSMLGKRNATGVVLEGDDEQKLQYLTSAMAASKTSGKVTYAA